VVKVEGSKVTAERGDQRKVRAKNNIKVVKERPVQLQVQVKKNRKNMEEDLDLEVDLDKIRVLSRAEQIFQPHLREQQYSDSEEGQADDRAEDEEDQDGSLVQGSSKRGRSLCRQR